MAKSTNEKALEIIELIGTVADIPKEKIGLKSQLVNDLELDSLAIFSLISALEDKYHIRIEETDFNRLLAVEDVVQYLDEKKAWN